MRSFVVNKLNAKLLVTIVWENVAKGTRIMRDEAGQYKHVGKDFAGYDFTRHGQGECVNCEDRTIQINTIEGYFSIFKHGMNGIYQHCGIAALHRSLYG